MRHAVRRVLEAEHEAALEMVFGALQLGARNRRCLHALQFLDDEIDHFADGFIRAAGVNRKGPGVAIRAQPAEDRVRQPAFFADVLEQPRAHRAAEQRVEHIARIAIVVALRIAADADANVALLELLVPDLRLGHDLRRLLADRLAGGLERSELLVDEITDALVLEVPHGRDDQVARGVRLSKVIT